MIDKEEVKPIKEILELDGGLSDVQKGMIIDMAKTLSVLKYGRESVKIEAVNYNGEFFRWKIDVSLVDEGKVIQHHEVPFQQGLYEKK